jgi:hypothetical protein
MLTATQRAEFDARGFVRLHDMFDVDHAARMRRVVWSELDRRYGIVEDDRSTWRVPSPTSLKTSKKHRAFSAIGSPELYAVIDGLLGADEWTRPEHWGQVMVTFPTANETWRVPSKLWHIDWFYSNTPEPLFGLKVFACFGEVQPCGDDPNPRRNAYFMDADHDLDGIPVRVVELTGEPGDVVLAHPWLLHHAAPNTASYPRMMRGKNLHCRAANWATTRRDGP